MVERFDIDPRRERDPVYRSDLAAWQDAVLSERADLDYLIEMSDRIRAERGEPADE